MTPRCLPASMETSLARAALARLAAQRSGRPVRPEEIKDALMAEGWEAPRAQAAVDSLADEKLVYVIEGGWLPAVPAPVSRARIESASAAWLHR